MEGRAGEMNWHDPEYLCLALIKVSSLFSATAFLPVTWVKVCCSQRLLGRYVQSGTLIIQSTCSTESEYLSRHPGLNTHFFQAASSPNLCFTYHPTDFVCVALVGTISCGLLAQRYFPFLDGL